jgi:1-phosphatidylinositol-4-phosphate 5-kinase
MQMKLGLEASIGLSTTSASANNKFKNHLVDNRGVHFKFNTYCNSQFAALRTMAGIDTETFRQSLGSVTALGFSGKSGSVLLRSADNLLVLKTISTEESAFLRRILSQYSDYMKRHPNTILTRFWGLYKVIKSPVVKVSFIVMKNAFSSGHKIHERYDLKGSRVGRHSGEENLRLSRVMLKDLDLCQMNRRIRLGPARRQHFLDQVTSDCKFLEKFDIIDYSLILGIHYTDDTPETVGAGGELDEAQEEARRAQTHTERLYGEIRAKNDNNEAIEEMYFMTIIDFLQPYNLRKQLEYNVKSIRYGDDMSVIPPSQYASRFISFITAVAD